MEGVLDECSAREFLTLVSERLAPSTTMFAGIWRGSTSFQGSDAELPTITLGLRDQVLFRITLSALLGVDKESSREILEFPGILWPEDMSWYLSTDIDYNSTIVGGTTDFIDSIIAQASIEAVAISPSLDLTYG